MDSWDEIDWRLSPLGDALDALDRSLAALPSDYSDGDDILERADELIGIGFVALQAYVRGTLEALWRLDSPAGQKKEQWEKEQRRRSADVIGATGTTVVEAIWAAANYYKHHEEWTDWAAAPRAQDTLAVLGRLAITKTTAYRCVEILRTIQGDNIRLRDALSRLSKWRESLMAAQTGVSQRRITGAARD